MHYTVQRIYNKFDVIQAELSSFDVLAFSETWLSPSVTDNNLKLSLFHPPERKDRHNHNHGGVLLYVKSSISYKISP